MSDKDPHHSQELEFVIMGSLYGMGSALVSGYCTACIANQEGFKNSVVLALMIAIMAVFSLVANFGKGSVWAELVTLVLISPAVVWGGFLRRKQLLKNPKFQKPNI